MPLTLKVAGFPSGKWLLLHLPPPPRPRYYPACAWAPRVCMCSSGLSTSPAHSPIPSGGNKQAHDEHIRTEAAESKAKEDALRRKAAANKQRCPSAGSIPCLALPRLVCARRQRRPPAVLRRKLEQERSAAAEEEAAFR